MPSTATLRTGYRVVAEATFSGAFSSFAFNTGSILFSVNGALTAVLDEESDMAFPTNVFYLKEGDTRPSIIVNLKNPDGAAFNLAGATSKKLLIHLSDGTYFSRDMTTLDAAAGVLGYSWVAADWADGTPGGFLIVGPSLPLRPGEREHRVEYEVVNANGRFTFPNNGYHTLRVLAGAEA